MFKNLKNKAVLCAVSTAAVIASVAPSYAAGLTDGITQDTATVTAGAALVVAAYGALWAINKVIAVFKK